MSDTVVVVPDRGQIDDGTRGATPSGQADIEVKAINPVMMVLIRGARTYLQALIGFAAVGVAVGGLPGYSPADAIPLATLGQKLWISAQLAVAPAVVSLLQNGLELIAKLDQSAPTLRA